MRALLLVLVAALVGCAGMPATQTPRQLLADDSFAAVPRPPIDEDIFAFSDAMREFAETILAANVARNGPAVGLAATIKRELRLEYDSRSTLPAAETFAAGSGNCLSLVILAAAFAKHLNLPVTYKYVYGQDAWSRADGLAVLSTHVNVQLGSRGYDGPTVDIVDAAHFRRVVEHPIDESTVRAMYFNNRAAEAIVAGDAGGAYWWARAAIHSAPTYVNGVNTLAVVYLRHGRLRDAERALRFVLRREPANARAMTNLVRALERAGRAEEAQAWRTRLAALEPYPPFYFLDQGLQALAQGEYLRARELLERELQRMPYHDEVHFALALADLRLGEMRAARKHLTLAERYSTRADRRDLYGAKLARIRELETR